MLGETYFPACFSMMKQFTLPFSASFSCYFFMISFSLFFLGHIPFGKIFNRLL